MQTTASRILSSLVFPFTPEFWAVHGTLFVLSSILLISFWYYLVDKYNMEANKMKCVFQYISSMALSLICWPVVLDLWIKYFQFGMDIGRWLDYDSYGYYKIILNLFLSSLILDLLFGVIYFRKQMFILNGWFHHSAYILLILYIMRWKSYNIFLLAVPEEVPTYFISIYVVFPQNNRKLSERMFCITFFLFRIAYHISGYSLLFLPPENRQTTQLWIPTSLTIFAHCYWYLLWLRKHWRSLFSPHRSSFTSADSSHPKNGVNNQQGTNDILDHYSKIEQDV
ncbi:putative integral membrane protein [Cryptosporidium felis]|nr:putative integral membrane protein [Cryptosporidium felis]